MSQEKTYEIRMNYAQVIVVDIEDLNTIIDEYDKGLNETIELGYQSDRYGWNFNLLEHFRASNPNFDYCRVLTKERTFHLSHFYERNLGNEIKETEMHRNTRKLIYKNNESLLTCEGYTNLKF